MKTEWVNCPICQEPDMLMTILEDGHTLINCTNHACRSNRVSPVIKINESHWLQQVLDAAAAGKEYKPWEKPKL